MQIAARLVTVAAKWKLELTAAVIVVGRPLSEYVNSLKAITVQSKATNLYYGRSMEPASHKRDEAVKYCRGKVWCFRIQTM